MNTTSGDALQGLEFSVGEWSELIVYDIPGPTGRHGVLLGSSEHRRRNEELAAGDPLRRAPGYPDSGSASVCMLVSPRLRSLDHTRDYRPQA